MPDLSDPRVHKLAVEILARSEYAQATGPDTTLVRMLRWFLGELGKLQFLRVEAPIVYWMIIGAMVLVLAALAGHLIWVLWAALGTPEPAAHEGLLQSSRQRDLAQEAAALASNGRYLDAAHRLMLASFRVLAESSVIELRPDRPNRWIRSALLTSSLPADRAAEIGALIEQTEQLWFGERRDEPAIYDRWCYALDQLGADGK